MTNTKLMNGSFKDDEYVTCYDELATGERVLSPPCSVALTPRSPVKESSSENAAMVLKNVKASQGNVCPVDILEK
jgi:hypothetical protein